MPFDSWNISKYFSIAAVILSVLIPGNSVFFFSNRKKRHRGTIVTFGKLALNRSEHIRYILTFSAFSDASWPNFRLQNCRHALHHGAVNRIATRPSLELLKIFKFTLSSDRQSCWFQKLYFSQTSTSSLYSSTDWISGTAHVNGTPSSISSPSEFS